MKMKPCFLLFLFFFLLTIACTKKNNDEITKGTVTDIDGNIYKTIKIGTQWWMGENLKTTRYRNGDTIPSVIDNGQWSKLNIGAKCINNNDLEQFNIYGYLYNWFAVIDSRNVAPNGWHVPSNSEWETLILYLGGDSVAGGKLREIGTTHWEYQNTGASNISGFTALPGGDRIFSGVFRNPGGSGTWWTTTENKQDMAWNWYIYSINTYAYQAQQLKTYGYSVRCVKD
jgi:uncharacterized protein (TIGR02145 family)